MNFLFLFVPISVVLAYFVHAPAAWVFVTGVLAIVPIAEYIRKATEHVAARAGSAVGGLLNVTFGNVSELVIALFILAAGNANVVKAQITGSIIGTSLFGLGLAILIGGATRERQTFNMKKADPPDPGCHRSSASGCIRVSIVRRRGCLRPPP